MADYQHPTLDQILPIEKIPNELEAVRDALVSVLHDLFVKDLVVGKSDYGDAGFYSFIIKSYEGIGIDLPMASDLKLVLNPDNTGGGTTEIPVSFEYSWFILRYISTFSLDEFDNSARSVLDILFELANTSPGSLLQEAMNLFNPQSPGIASFLQKFNTEYGENISQNSITDLTESEQFEWAAEKLNEKSYDAVQVIFELFIDGQPNDSLAQVKALFNSHIADISRSLMEVIQLNFSATIREISVGLQFPRKWLVPVYTESEPVQGLQLDDPLPEEYHSVLSFEVGTFRYSSKDGFNFYKANDFNLSRSIIGNTGLIISFSDLRVDLSRKTNIPEADADGRPENFMGAYAGEAVVALPSKWFNNVDNSTLQLVGRNLLIGTGGVSGTIGLETLNGQPNNGSAFLSVQIGNWQVRFDYFNLTFHQNAITQSHIGGTLQIPKLKDADGNDALIAIDGGFSATGDFNLTASEPDGIPFTLFDFVTFNITSLELGSQNDDFYIGTSCEISFQSAIMDKILGDQKIVIPKLRFYDNGQIEIVGGNTAIPTNINLDLGPVQIAVTNVHFGSYEGNGRKYNYWGFDGAISLDPLGLDARGEGIKYYYTIDNDEHNGQGDDFLHIQTIEVDLVIPGSASPDKAMAMIHGMLSVPEPGASEQYYGEISLKVPKAKISGKASMSLQPKPPAFAVDASISLPAPIPLGPFAIYGFRGLFGYKYVAEKEYVGLSPDSTWYEYYQYRPRGIAIKKFNRPPATNDYQTPYSLGAGAVLGTSFDGGTVLNLRAMLLLSLPSLFTIDGRANILSERIGLDTPDEPPFFANLTWSSDDIEVSAGVDYELPAHGHKGWILDLYALIQARFPFDHPKGWYVHFGTKDKPITAEVLTILTTKAYLMLSSSGIETGARADFNLEKRFGPAKVKFSAYVEVGGHISFERPQIGGYVAAGGELLIDIWIVSVHVTLDAILGVEAAKPFLIYAEVRIRPCIHLLFASVCHTFHVKLKWEFDHEVDRDPIAPLPSDRTQELVKGVHMLTNEEFPLQYFGTSAPNASSINSILPLDTFVDIKTEKGLIPNVSSSKIGGYYWGAENYTDLIPPDKTVRGGHELRQVKHQYSVEDLVIKAYNGSSWVDYKPYKAVVADDERNQLPDLLGTWQSTNKQYDTIRLLASTPFDFTQAGEPGWFIPEQFGITASELFCEGVLKHPHCLDFANKDVGTIYFPPTQFVAHYINGAYFTLSGFYYYGYNFLANNDYYRVTDAPNPHGFERSLEFTNDNNLVILLPSPSVEVRLTLSTKASGVTLTYKKSLLTDGNESIYQTVDEEYKSYQELNSGEHLYSNEDEPISKIIITPDHLDENTLASLEAQLAELKAEAYANYEGGDFNMEDTDYWDSILDLKNQIETLKNENCISEECEPNERYCVIFDNLGKIFTNCFVYPLIDLSQIDASKCLSYFTSAVQGFLNSFPGEEAYLNPEWNIYQELAGIVSEWQSNADIDLKTYTDLRNVAFIIIDKINTLGNCACRSSCDRNLAVCFYEKELDALYNSYFITIHEPSEIAAQLDKFKLANYIMHNYLLSESYPLSETVIIQLFPLIDQYNRALDKLSDEINRENFETLKEKLEDLLIALQEIGNCNCNEDDYICNTLVQQVCWLTLEDFEYNQTVPGQDAINEQHQAMKAAIEKTAQPIWRPNTRYYIHFKLKDLVDNDEGNNNGTYDYYYGFKTVGPVGHYHRNDEVDYLPNDADPDRYPLTSLRSYIDYERSYPNANGDLLRSKPLFYGHEQCKISLYFIKAMVSHMLQKWEDYQGMDAILGSMHISIKDPVSDEIIPYPLPENYENEHVPFAFSQAWVEDLNPLQGVHLEALNNMIEAVQNGDESIICTPELGSTLRPNSPSYELVLTNLKPEKLYTALVYNAFDEDEDGTITTGADLASGTNSDELEDFKVHEFVFRTSRYANFREQVESYLFRIPSEGGNGEETQQAVFELSGSFTSDEINRVSSLISDPANHQGDPDLIQDYQHPFDRIIEGILDFDPLPPAEQTEFNRIVNESTGDVIALLIRNPEPFNSPKMPLDEIGDTIRIMTNSSSPDHTYSTLFSKDYSACILMNGQKNIQTVQLNFQFLYKTWNGDDYVPVPEPDVPQDEKLHTVYVENIIVNP